MIAGCVSPVHTFNEVIASPQVSARQMLQNIPQQTNSVQHPGIPIKLSETPGTIRSQAPEHGEHTKQILCQFGVKKK
ncbi:hypothetical protein GCM10008986_03170 [Salinibacillus aidingensis]|uniref:Uncharacterized protein n=2 Tax=Salinibacillus aidingensis TaxID=237684 RepID=A0ABN1ARB5_9BACI